MPTEKSFNEANGDKSKYRYEEYIITARKDGGASIHKYHLVPSSGISEYEKDLTNPLLVAAGECAEEVHLRDKYRDDVWYRPRFTSESFNNEDNKKYSKYLTDLNTRIEETVDKRRECFLSYLRDPKQKTKYRGMPYSDHVDATNEYLKVIGTPEPVDAEFYPLGKDKLSVKFGDESSDYNGLLVIDEKYGAIDLMTTIILTLEKPISHLLVLDGESHKKKLLWRNVFVFKPKQLQNVFNGKKAKALLFGCPNERSKWENGVLVELTEEMDINPPLLKSGEALLKKRYGLDITTPYEQQNKREPLDVNIVKDSEELQEK